MPAIVPFFEFSEAETLQKQCGSCCRCGRLSHPARNCHEFFDTSGKALESMAIMLKNKQTGHCLENGGGESKGHDVAASNNDNQNSKLWIYEPSKQTFCNMETGYCLENGGWFSPMHFVKAYPPDGELNKRWRYDTQNQTLCNAATGRCLENGGAFSQNNTVRAFPDDSSDNKKWEMIYMVGPSRPR